MAEKRDKKFEFDGQKWYIDGYIANVLNTVVYNLPKDWDCIIIITGNRTVRIGKSVLAMTICAYIASRMKQVGIQTKFGLDDLYFDSESMTKAALQKPKYSINWYDEGGEVLAKSMWSSQKQRDLIQFFEECGQLNQVFVIVAPDFFKLNEGIAVARSEHLFNVFRANKEKILYENGEQKPVIEYVRGRVEYFNRKSKALLYDIAQSTKKRNYSIVNHEFWGSFTDQYPLHKPEYIKRKYEALRRFEAKRDKEKDEKSNRYSRKMQQVVQNLVKDGKTLREIAEIIELTEERARQYTQM